ncbi:MAG: ribonuclease P protein component [Bacteroidales bacterium]|jgi:ribonuclease P protein component
MNNNLPKQERLRNKFLIKNLFDYGEKINKSGFICFWHLYNYNGTSNKFGSNSKNINSENILCKDVDINADLDKTVDNKVKVMVSVSKKHHKLAVNRNKIKRLLKESYRLNKNLIHKFVNKNEQLLICFIYTKKDIPLYSKTNEVMIEFLNDIAKKLKKNNNE